MLQIKAATGDVGVIIGRFQTPVLHEGHCELIETVMARHRKVLVLVGSMPDIRASRRNSLDYFTRMKMLRARYPDLAIAPIHDMPSDADWSKSVDLKIQETFDSMTAVLYGSRDAFIPHYQGRFPTIQLEPSKNLTATEIRNIASEEVRESEDFRRGVIYGTYARHATAYPTVDIAVIDPAYRNLGIDWDNSKILLGRKAHEVDDRWRFPGGFVNPGQDTSLELAAIRELHEEVPNIEISSPTYIGSTIVGDWRYRNEDDKIMTSLFLVHFLFGSAKAGDDLAQVKWVKVYELMGAICATHKPLAEMLISHLKKEK